MRVQFSDGADRLTGAYPTLPRQLKKCAAYILEHPSEVATLSMRQVAARAGVPPSTLIRLARALDFPAYSEFRALYRDSVNRLSAGFSSEAGALPGIAAETPLDHAIEGFHQAALSNIETLFDHVDRDALDRAVAALAGARSVVAFGTHASHALAAYLHHLAAAGFRNWHLPDRHAGGLSHLLEALTPEDAVVAIAVEPAAADTVAVARHARAAGARVVGIADRRTSPLAAWCDDLLLFPVRSPSFFPSHVAAAALVEMLAGMVLAQGGRAAAGNVEGLERRRREIGEYCEE